MSNNEVVVRYQAVLEVVVDRATGRIVEHSIRRDEGLKYAMAYALEDEERIALSPDERDRIEEDYTRHMERFPVPLGDF